MIAVCTCACGSVDNLVRNFLKGVNYEYWFDIPITKGKKPSKGVLCNLPVSPEREMLEHYLSEASTWAVIIGYGQGLCRWADIAHQGAKSRIEAETIINTFS